MGLVVGKASFSVQFQRTRKENKKTVPELLVSVFVLVIIHSTECDMRFSVIVSRRGIVLFYYVFN